MPGGDEDEVEAFFDAVRGDDVAVAATLLSAHSEYAARRWLGRAGKQGMLRSLGPRPYNQHTWRPNPEPVGSTDPRYTSTPLIFTRNDEMVALLLAFGADPSALGTSGDLELLDWFLTPLWRASHDNRLRSVRRLVDAGADVNARNPDGSNQALKTALENDGREVVEYLIQRGAEADIISACMIGLPERVEALLADDLSLVSTRDEHGRSPLDACTLLDSFRPASTCHGPQHDRCAMLLIGKGAEPDLAHAASLGWTDRVEDLLRADPACSARCRHLEALPGGTATPEGPLKAARRRGRVDVVARLLAAGAPEEPEVIID
jgi:ankyrin repeat protein